jgi:hypothetical protein
MRIHCGIFFGGRGIVVRDGDGSGSGMIAGTKLGMIAGMGVEIGLGVGTVVGDGRW